MANKGFSFELNEEDIESRPRKAKFHADHLDFDESFNADLWIAAHSAPPQSKTGRFITLSAMAHVVFFAGVFTLAVPMFEQPKTETVTIEIEDAGLPLPRGERASPSASAIAAPAQAPQVAPEETSKDELASAADDVVVAARKPREAAKPAPAARTNVADVRPMATESDVEVPEKIDDLEAEELEESQFLAAAAGQYEGGELDKNFAKIDEKSADGVNGARAELDREADRMAQDDLGEIEKLDRENQESAKAMAARADALKRKNAAALAAARAQENAARERAEREQAARLAGAARGDEAATAVKGDGGTGSSAGAGRAAGVPGGVRALENLRQMPGNPKPAYSESERFAKHQGTASFVAYVNREGYPTQFRQVRSSGHANLDGKTLAALKKWRFYPGQEGWVEIPMRWDLRGGVHETSALANRRSAGPSPGRLLRTSN